MPKSAMNKVALAKYNTVVYNREIKDYCDDFFFSAMHAWYMTKTWGMAFSGGWAEQPYEYLEAITAIEGAHNEVENEEMEKSKKQNSSKQMLD